MTTLLKATVAAILKRADQYEWQLQGLGMLRLYLSKEIRLHVWDSRYAVPNVSTVHTHPWSFESTVVAGEIRQRRLYHGGLGGAFYLRQTLKCGPGGGLVGEPAEVYLTADPVETYREGSTYGQAAREIHISDPLNGTVTIVRRSFEGDEDHAYVFWYKGDEWVSAEPRVATQTEVLDITGRAIEQWF